MKISFDRNTLKYKEIIVNDLASVDVDEVWTPIVEENNYEVSNTGRVRNLITGKFLSQRCVADGRLKVSLNKKYSYVHTLVAKAFFGNPPDESNGVAMTVDHINRKPWDNRISNLRYATKSEQALNRRPKPSNTNYDRPVAKLDAVTNTELERFKSTKDACRSLYGNDREYEPRGLYDALKGRRDMFGGFKWIYLDEAHLPSENWKVVTQVQDKYGVIAISDKGRAKFTSGKITYGSKTASGYMTVPISKGKSAYVHRLVAEMFLAETRQDGQTTVNHKDRNTKNNSVESLEFATPQEQVLHVIDTGRRSLNKTVYQYSKDGVFIAKYESCEKASKISGFQPSGIGMAASGKSKWYKGYIWRYENVPLIIHEKKLRPASKVSQFSSTGALVQEFESIKIASKVTGISISTLRQACRSQKNVKGYIWRYEDSHSYKHTKKIEQLSLIDNKVVNVFNSIADASRELNVLPGNLSKALNGKTYSCVGYKWRFSEDNSSEKSHKVDKRERESDEIDRHQLTHLTKKIKRH